MRHKTTKLTYYAPLIGMCLLSIVGFSQFWYNASMLRAITVALVAGYVTWGIVYHLIRKDIKTSIILEYIVTGALGLAAILSLI